MELINSPFFFFFALCLIALFIFIKSKFSKKCHACKRGRMRIVEKHPLEVVTHNPEYDIPTQGFRGQTTSVKVRMKVIYQCDQCGARSETIEQR